MASARAMVTVAEARERARKRVELEQRDWAANGGADALLDIVLRPPTENEARADQTAAIAWVNAWRAVDAAGSDVASGIASGVTVQWSERHWPSVGRQSVPERVMLRGADAIAEFAGATHGRSWRTRRDRAARLGAEFDVDPAPDGPVESHRFSELHGDFVELHGDVEPHGPAAITVAVAAAIRAQARTLQRLGDADFATLLAVVAWLRQNPASGWRVRQLPIRGIDTKWLEGHRSVVEALHAAVSGRESLGLLEAPDRVRVRFLDPHLRPGGLRDVSAPIEDLAALDVAPSTVFVFENLETVLAMPDVAGAVVVHGSGFAIPRLRGIPWISAGRIIYWGDLDSHGFAILHALRVALGSDDVTSVLMDEETLLAYRDLWVSEPKPAVGVYPTLSTGEQRALERLRTEGNVRLEQERIPWAVAMAQLVRAATPPPANAAGRPDARWLSRPPRTAG
jgi:hypothetical protein